MCDHLGNYANQAAAQVPDYWDRVSTKPKRDSHEAAREFARFLERELGIDSGTVKSTALRLLIRAYWSRVAKLAHEIHDDRD